MTTFNFSEVADNTATVSKQVKPSIDKFKIKSMEFKANVNGKEYFLVEFLNQAEQTFKHLFYVSSPKALARVKELATSCKVTLGNDTPEQVIAKLVGKALVLVVDGTKEITNIEGKDVVVTRPNLRFVNFSATVDSGMKLGDGEGVVKIEDKTGGFTPGSTPVSSDPLAEATGTTSTVDSDLPW